MQASEPILHDISHWLNIHSSDVTKARIALILAITSCGLAGISALLSQMMVRSTSLGSAYAVLHLIIAVGATIGCLVSLRRWQIWVSRAQQSLNAISRLYGQLPTEDRFEYSRLHITPSWTRIFHEPTLPVWILALFSASVTSVSAMHVVSQFIASPPTNALHRSLQAESVERFFEQDCTLPVWAQPSGADTQEHPIEISEVPQQAKQMVYQYTQTLSNLCFAGVWVDRYGVEEATYEFRLIDFLSDELWEIDIEKDGKSFTLQETERPICSSQIRRAAQLLDAASNDNTNAISSEERAQHAETLRLIASEIEHRCPRGGDQYPFIEISIRPEKGEVFPDIDRLSRDWFRFPAYYEVECISAKAGSTGDRKWVFNPQAEVVEDDQDAGDESTHHDHQSAPPRCLQDSRLPSDTGDTALCDPIYCADIGSPE